MSDLLSREDYNLYGKTLLIYLYLLLVRKPTGIRELQKKLNFSSPSVVHYHLNKLINLGLVKQVSSKYIAQKIIKIGILKQFLIIKSKLVPRYFLYAAFFTTILIAYIVLLRPNELTRAYFLGLTAIIFATVISWIESYLLWKELNKMLQETKPY